MQTTKLRKVGGSVMMAVPPFVLEQLRLQPGVTVGVTVQEGRLIIDPQPRPRYDLGTLLAACDASVPVTDDDLKWLAIKPVGGELL